MRTDRRSIENSVFQTYITKHYISRFDQRNYRGIVVIENEKILQDIFLLSITFEGNRNVLRA